jgi:hypothetical protein
MLRRRRPLLRAAAAGAAGYAIGKLRDDGLLTDEEFEAQKEKLLQG